MKSVFEYDDYRGYLKDVHDYGNRASFSWRAISLRANITNPNFLRQVMLGERNLSEKTMDVVGKAIGLQDAELEYWLLLVKLGQSDKDESKRHYRQELAQFRGAVSPVKIGEGFSEYYRHWYIPAIRELVTLFDFKDDFALLGRSVYPPITESEARSAVQILARFHFIYKDDDGRGVEADRALRSGTPKQRSALIHYHREMLGKASEALFALDKDKRFVGGMTLGVSKECYRRILAETEKFKNRVASLALNDSKGDKVIQVAVQIFPMGYSPDRNR